MFKPYETFQFNSLPDFELASRRPDSVLRMAQSCGRVLCRYGCQELLAICLLHKHFDLEPNERLVRTLGRRKRAHAVPIATKAAGDVIPWIWRFSEGTSGPGWYPLEYVQSSPSGRGLYTLLERCDPVFDELALVLQQNALEDVFGVSALYADEGLQVDDHEHTVETSSIRPRRLNLTVSPRVDNDSDDDATVTQYRWRDVSAFELVQ